MALAKIVKMQGLFKTQVTVTLKAVTIMQEQGKLTQAVFL
jgi:hypothetical protein